MGVFTGMDVHRKRSQIAIVAGEVVLPGSPAYEELPEPFNDRPSYPSAGRPARRRGSKASRR
jgi:hypothetical protein